MPPSPRAPTHLNMYFAARPWSRLREIFPVCGRHQHFHNDNGLNQPHAEPCLVQHFFWGPAHSHARRHQSGSGTANVNMSVGPSGWTEFYRGRMPPQAMGTKPRREPIDRPTEPRDPAITVTTNNSVTGSPQCLSHHWSRRSSNAGAGSQCHQHTLRPRNASNIDPSQSRRLGRRL